MDKVSIKSLLPKVTYRQKDLSITIEMACMLYERLRQSKSMKEALPPQKELQSPEEFYNNLLRLSDDAISILGSYTKRSYLCALDANEHIRETTTLREKVNLLKNDSRALQDCRHLLYILEDKNFNRVYRRVPLKFALTAMFKGHTFKPDDIGERLQESDAYLNLTLADCRRIKWVLDGMGAIVADNK